MPRKKKKSHLKLGKETFGDIPREEAFRKAFDPYFKNDKGDVLIDRRNEGFKKKDN